MQNFCPLKYAYYTRICIFAYVFFFLENIFVFFGKQNYTHGFCRGFMYYMAAYIFFVFTTIKPVFLFRNILSPFLLLYTVNNLNNEFKLILRRLLFFGNSKSYEFYTFPSVVDYENSAENCVVFLQDCEYDSEFYINLR